MTLHTPLETDVNRTVSLPAVALMGGVLSLGWGASQARAQAVNLTPPDQTGQTAQPSTNATPGTPAAPQPDKSTYNLFNPTPDAQERSFSPDRPNKSTGPYTLDAGHFQYEMDLLGVQGDYYNGSHTQSRQIFTADPVLKLGLTNNVDLELGLGGFSDTRVKQKNAGPATVYEGYGDTTLHVKINVWGNDSGQTAFALVPWVKIPTAAQGLGNDQVEGGLIAPLQITLPYNFTAVLQTEADVLKNANDSGKHSSFTNIVNVSYPLTPKLTGSLELYSQIQAQDNPDIYTLDASLAYLIGPNTQIDAAAYAGLNKAAPDVTGYMGISQRF
jgi:hypothetical protein